MGNLPAASALLAAYAAETGDRMLNSGLLRARTSPFTRPENSGYNTFWRFRALFVRQELQRTSTNKSIASPTSHLYARLASLLFVVESMNMVGKTRSRT
jgi:hypothetical protein